MRDANLRRLIPAAVAMLILILETKTAAEGIQNGIEVCLYRLIPSIFPFLILSRLMTSLMIGSAVPVFCRVCGLCRMPAGSESLLLVGFLGGYPVGAANVADAHRRGSISRSDASRMAVFCSNAGPSFLFGVIGPMFSGHQKLWLLWCVHMASAVLCGMLMPGGNPGYVKIPSGQPVSLADSVTAAVKTMGMICGWVILFRMILEFLDRWLFWLLPGWVSVLLTGLLELSNGCIRLEGIENADLRFLLASVMLSFGGLCVWMQTNALCGSLDLRQYLPGKLLQAGVAVLLSMAVILLQRVSGLYYVVAFSAVALFSFRFLRIWLHRRKKEVAF